MQFLFVASVVISGTEFELYYSSKEANYRVRQFEVRSGDLLLTDDDLSDALLLAESDEEAVRTVAEFATA
jgi:hypothetical protein